MFTTRTFLSVLCLFSSFSKQPEIFTAYINENNVNNPSLRRYEREKRATSSGEKASWRHERSPMNKQAIILKNDGLGQ